MMRWFVAVMFLAVSATAGAAPNTSPGTWNFKVSLDDKPIGYQRFALAEQGDVREMSIEARFDAKFYAVFSYHYAHDATERWAANCLISLTASTDDDGKKTRVSAKRNGDGDEIRVAGPGGEKKYSGCLMTFAYWNPEILKQTRLLNSQTGEVETVKVEALGKEPIAVRGVQVNANHYRINGPKHPINLWYSDAGEWLALTSPLDGGRQLVYRLE
jgi:Family of unknown function (DUF6134)